MEAKLLNFTKTPIPMFVSSPTPNYEIMQSLLSMSNSPSASSMTPNISATAVSGGPSQESSPVNASTSFNSKSSPRRKGDHRESNRSVATMTKKQEKSFIRNTINLINNHSSRTIAKDLVLSATRKQKHAAAAAKQRLLATAANASVIVTDKRSSHLVSPESRRSNHRRYQSTQHHHNHHEHQNHKSLKRINIECTPTAQQNLPSQSRYFPTMVTSTNTALLEDAESLNVVETTTTTMQQLSTPTTVATASNTVFTWLEHNYNEQVSTQSVEVVEQQHNQQRQSSEEDKLSHDGLTSTPQQDHLENLNKMIECYCLLENDFLKNYPKVKLKCSVCSTPFDSLLKLLEHKEFNQSCVNNIRIGDETAITEATTNIATEPTKFVIVQINTDEEYFSDPDFLNNETTNINQLTNSKSNTSILQTDILSQPKETPVKKVVKKKIIKKRKRVDSTIAGVKSKKNDEQKDETRKPNNEENETVNNIEIDVDKNDSNSQNQLEETCRASALASSTETQNSKEEKPRPRRKYEKRKEKLCGRKCITKAELQVHLHKHDGKEPVCWECGKKCTTFSNLVSHFLVHTGEKPFSCQFCHRMFTQIAHLNRHMRLHTGERPFICNICGKTYKDYSYFKVHLRIHRGERIYKCEYCAKEYFDASYYKKHVRLHTGIIKGEKPYKCTICGRQFHRSDYLKLHSYSHTKDRPFKCHICGKGYTMNHNLKLHMRQRHHLVVGTVASANGSCKSATDQLQTPIATTTVIQTVEDHETNEEDAEDIEQISSSLEENLLHTKTIAKATSNTQLAVTQEQLTPQPTQTIVHLFNHNDILSSTAYLCEEDLANLESTFESSL